MLWRQFGFFYCVPVWGPQVGGHLGLTWSKILSVQHDTFDAKHSRGNLCRLQCYISCLLHLLRLSEANWYHSRCVVIRAGDKNVAKWMPWQTPDHRLMSLLNTAKLLLIAIHTVSENHYKQLEQNLTSQSTKCSKKNEDTRTVMSTEKRHHLLIFNYKHSVIEHWNKCITDNSETSIIFIIFFGNFTHTQAARVAVNSSPSQVIPKWAH